MPSLLLFHGARRALLLLSLSVWAGAAVGADAKVLNALFDGVLQDHVKDGYVDYPAIARNVRFTKYLQALAEFDPATLADDKDKMAFWINAYNALAIKHIIDGKSPNGVVDRLGFFGANGHIGGRRIDLSGIEHDILHKFVDPRLHFTLVPATASAPKLRSEAYSGEELDQQLEGAARDFINDKRKNRFSAALQAAKLSKIFETYRNEFGKTDKEVLKWVARYVNDPEVAKILNRGAYKIKYMDYDATINGNSIKSD